MTPDKEWIEEQAEKIDRLLWQDFSARPVKEVRGATKDDVLRALEATIQHGAMGARDIIRKTQPEVLHTSDALPRYRAQLVAAIEDTYKEKNS